MHLARSKHRRDHPSERSVASEFYWRLRPIHRPEYLSGLKAIP
jgi:hypothetical protein